MMLAQRQCLRLLITAMAAMMIMMVAKPAIAQDVPQLLRGPYLQMMSTDSVTVRWRTAQPCNSIVEVGDIGAPFSRLCGSEVPTTEHIVRIDGLQADTSYRYRIARAGAVLAGGDAGIQFRTHPAVGSTDSVRIWVLGDSGTANKNAAAVRDAYHNMADTRVPDVWLMLGDNAYEDGKDHEYQGAVFDMYTETLRQAALWPTIGNHDGRSADSKTESGVYYDIFSLPRRAESGGLASGTEAYYSFDYANIHFICLDSHHSDRSEGSPMLRWLEMDLAETRAEWIIAFFHHPPYTKGTHDSDDVEDSGGRMRDMRAFTLPILEAGGVDLVLSGHSHTYERSFLIDGHYGSSDTFEEDMKVDGGDGRPDGDGAYRKDHARAAHDGALYVVAGSSGKVGTGSLDHPAMCVSLSSLGSMVIDVSDRRLDARFLDDSGGIRDIVRIEHGVSPARNR